MTINFDALKQNRKTSFDKLTAELSKLNQNPSNQNSDDDNRFWKPDVDKAGNGYAVIRFLPAPKGEDVPFVRIWDHGFQGPGGWYIEKSLTTLGQPDPVSEYNSKLWNTGIESNKTLVRNQKRRLSYYSNILVVKDPNHPENEGKVFLYKYGKKIFDKLNEAMNPEFSDESAINPFDLWEGANFKLKIRQVEGYRNYDKSEFDTAGPASNNDDELEKFWESEHSLQELINPKHFKSYEDLKKRLEKAIGVAGSVTASPAYDAPEEKFATPPKAAPAPSAPTQSPPWTSNSDDDDEDLAFFKKLTKD
jgi:hypothetical protein